MCIDLISPCVDERAFKATHPTSTPFFQRTKKRYLTLLSVQYLGRVRNTKESLPSQM